ncbi:MAG: SdiA-regulated domain-containing protein [Pseudomonadota bacterium]
MRSTTRTILYHIALAWAVATGAASGQIAVQREDVITLPRALQEISGLTPAGAQRVLTHNDEKGIVYSVDLATGDVDEVLQLGSVAARADFEGITQYNDFLYLVTSNGLLYEARLDQQTKEVRFNTYDTGLDRVCEIEGIAADSLGRVYLLCKQFGAELAPARLVIYRWDLTRRLQPPEAWVDLAVGERFATLNLMTNDVLWTALSYDASRKEVLALAGRQGFVVSLNRDGVPTGAIALAQGAHRQPEGMAILDDRTLLISDEGGDGPGTLSIYRQFGD